MSVLLHPAPSWQPPTGTTLVLWHGCTRGDSEKIRLLGVDPRVGRLAVDFGRGFYATTIERQARHWAWLRHYDMPVPLRPTLDAQPVVARFEIPRDVLSKLWSLSFVDGHYDSDDFWSLVQHCRRSVERGDPTTPAGIIHDHEGPRAFDGHRWYDVVSGPVAAFWEQRSAMSHADQFSFHTPDGVRLLNNAKAGGPPAFQITGVP